MRVIAGIRHFEYAPLFDRFHVTLPISISYNKFTMRTEILTLLPHREKID